MINKSETKYIVLFAVIVLVYGVTLAGVITKVNDWRRSKSQEYLTEAKKATNDTDKLLLFEKAAVLDASEETFLGAGVTALKLDDNKLAEKYLGRVKTAEGYYQLANAYYNLDKYDQAVLNFQYSNQKKETTEALTGLGKSYLKQGNTDKAILILESAKKLQQTEEVDNLLSLLVPVNKNTDPANRAVIVYNALLEFGYPQSAENILRQAVKDEFVTRDGLIKMANEQIDGDDYQAAYDYLIRAKSIDSYYPQIYQQLLIVCEKLGKTNEVKQYQEFLSGISF